MQSSQRHLKFAKSDWEKVLWSEDTKLELFGINSTNHVWRERNSATFPRTPSPLAHNYTLGVFFCTGILPWMGRWMKPCSVKSWVKTSFPPPRGLLWVLHGTSNRITTQKIQPRNGWSRSRSALASLWTYGESCQGTTNKSYWFRSHFQRGVDQNSSWYEQKHSHQPQERLTSVLDNDGSGKRVQTLFFICDFLSLFKWTYHYDDRLSVSF